LFNPLLIVGIVLLYVSGLFLLALWVEKRSRTRQGLTRLPWVYALSLAVYCSAWTYYGSVGKAVSSGPIFLTIYLGPTLMFLFGGLIIKRLIRIKNRYHITSIADLISVRYNRSSIIAVIATILSFFSIIPYLALQIKAISSTFGILTHDLSESYPWVMQNFALLASLLMIAFTIAFGVRRLDPTERHPGIVAAVSAESIIKLITFLIVGAWITWGVFDGFGDITNRFGELLASAQGKTGYTDPPTFLAWNSYMILAMSAILFLPRQFHITVVENVKIKHVNTAMWLFPLYMLLLNVFVLPIALGGQVLGVSSRLADDFVILIPALFDKPMITLLVYIGGFSAASGMIMISTMTLATMGTNHIYLPVIESWPRLSNLRRHLLPARWAAVALVILAAYLFNRFLGGYFTLVSLGMIAFVAAMQFAPSVLGGLFWPRATRNGALAGLSVGFLAWVYTLMLPAMIHSGWLPQSILEHGPWGIQLLRPEHLFHTGANDPIVHAAFWSTSLNVLAYVVVSLLYPARAEERRLALEFISAGRGGEFKKTNKSGYTVDLNQKISLLRQILETYLSPHTIDEILDRSLAVLSLKGKQNASLLDLAELQGRVESALAGAVGSAVAHRAILNSPLFTDSERNFLRQEYGQMLETMQVAPADLMRRINYFQERESLLSSHAEELEAKLHELGLEIDRRRTAQVALEESELKYRQMIENLLDGFFIVQNGKLQYCNDRFAVILGYESPTSIAGNTFSEFLDNASAARIAGKFSSILANKSDSASVNVHGKRADSSAFDAIIQINQIQYAGRPAIQGTLRDVTEQNRLEAQLVQAQKMEAVGRLAGGIAHDFNNLLTVIGGNAQLLEMQLAEAAEEHTLLDEILKSTDQASSLTRQLLTFSRKQIINPKPVHIVDSFTRLKKMLDRLIGEDIRLEINSAEDVPPITIDPNQIEQILINLAVNARDAMPNGGTILLTLDTVSLEHEDLEDIMTIPEGDYVRLSVTDTGEGIPETYGREIFEPFFTTKEVGQGTGLGLATVYGIVQQNGGAIRFESEVGVGTTFELFFPPSLESSVEPSKHGSPQIDPSQGEGFSVLIVEDDDAVRSFTMNLLKKTGFDVITALNGRDAITRLQGMSKHPDLILTDVIMPEMSGVQLIQELAERGIKTKFIFMSGYSDTELTRQGMNLEEADFLQKPLSPRELLDRIADLLQL
jgi:PAS domain S-box-containing protein